MKFGHANTYLTNGQVCYDGIHLNYKCFISSDDSRDANWVDVMKNEIKDLNEYKTWTIVPFPTGKHAINCKWVYKF